MITVAIGHFDGSLDMLLALVRRHQYPIDDLPIAEITRKYLAYLKDAKEADVELGGDLLETASWLVLLKSRTMLPCASGEEPPSFELERALVDYETLRATAGLLRSRIDAAGLDPRRRLTDSEYPLPVEADESVRAQPTLQDALLAARRALAVAKADAQGSRSFRLGPKALQQDFASALLWQTHQRWPDPPYSGRAFRPGFKYIKNIEFRDLTAVNQPKEQIPAFKYSPTALVGRAAGVGVFQHVLTVDLVV